MKKILVPTFVLCFTLASAQNTNTFPLSGNAGVGTLTPNFNMQLHGTADYIVNIPPQPPIYDIFGNIIVPGSPGMNINHGKTARLGLTNTTTGLTSNDGLLIRMSGLNGVIENLEKQNLSIVSGGAGMTFSGSTGKTWFGGDNVPPAAATAHVNIVPGNDNGLYVRTSSAGKSGLTVQPKALTDNAIQVMGTDDVTKNFAVQGDGNVSIGGVPTSWGRLLITNSTKGASVHVEHTEAGTDHQKLIFFTYKNPKTEILKAQNVQTGITTHHFFASGKTIIRNDTRTIFQLESNGLLRLRRVKIDEANWPDYVFEKGYQLPTLSEVEKFIEQNGHLPNVPSREEVLKNGIEVGEMLRILTEKVEELTLYSIEQQKLIEGQQKVIEELVKNKE